MIPKELICLVVITYCGIMLIRNHLTYKFRTRLSNAIYDYSRTIISALAAHHRAELADATVDTVDQVFQRQNEEWEICSTKMRKRWKIEDSVSYYYMMGWWEPWRRFLSYYTSEQYVQMTGVALTKVWNWKPEVRPFIG